MILNQIFSIPLEEGKYLIYAPLKGIAFIGNAPLINEIVEYSQRLTQNELPQHLISCDSSRHEKESNDVIGFLNQLDFFYPEPIPMDNYHKRGVQYDTIILFLTNQCNLRCSYCYASSNEYPQKMMTWEIAKTGIDFVLDHVKKNDSPVMTLGFHGGGEPTLNWDILVKATEYAKSISRKNDLDLHITGSFNGFWPIKVTRYVIQNFTEISLSFDGLPSTQNAQRPAVNNKASFQKVSETLYALDRARFSYGIRMTVTNASVSNLEENISFICENFKPRKIQVEPVFMEGRAIKNRSAISDLDIFIYQFIRAVKKAEQHNIQLFYSGARLEAVTTRFCLAACRALVITADGNITTCFEVFGQEHPSADRFMIGKYEGNGKISIDEQKLIKNSCRTIDQISYCEDCFCKWHCAGDCSVKTFSKGPDGCFQPTERCYVNRELIKLLVLKKIMDNDGIVWINNFQ